MKITIFKITLLFLILVSCSNNKNQNYKKNDTLNVPYAYWWPNTGPYLSYQSTNNEFSFAIFGIVTKLDSVIQKPLYNAQNCTIEILEIIKENKFYKGQKYFSSDCFFQSNLQIGDSVMVFCYDYENGLITPGLSSVIKTNKYSKSYIKSIKNKEK